MTSAKDLEPPGYGFNPTEQEIVGHYLPHKIRGNHSQVSEIAEIDNIRKYEPWDLPGLAKKPSSKHQWYFFSPRNSGLCKRTTKAGSWKVTGRKYELKNRANQLIIKRYLVFHTGRGSNAVRTNWIIHEYYLKPSNSNERGYVIYRLFQNRRKSPKKIVNSAVDEGESSHDSASAVENPATDFSSPEIEPQFMDEISNSDEHICQDWILSEPPSPFGVQQDNNTEPLGTPQIGYASYPEAVEARTDQCLSEVHMLQGLAHQYNWLWPQSGASAMEDNISEWEKSRPAVPDVTTYSRSTSDCYPLQSSGSLHVEKFSDTEALCSLYNGGIETAPGVDSGWVWD